MLGNGTDTLGRVTVFSPRIEDLLRNHVGDDLFRLDPGTVGVAGAVLVDKLMGSRLATEAERLTFGPLWGHSIPRTRSSAVMQAVTKDVRAAVAKPVDEPADLRGPWPIVGHRYLRDSIFGADPYRLRILCHRKVDQAPRLTWTVITAGAVIPGPRSDTSTSSLGAMLSAADSYRERRFASGLYRRAMRPICFAVPQLVANAMWLGSPFDEGVPSRNIILETLRLLPPAWSLLRLASPEFPELDQRIGAQDDVLILPLLTHRDPAIWDAPDEFHPERWDAPDADTQFGYLPFGHASERCWGRHLVMPLAERLLDVLRADRLTVSPHQRSADVPLAGLFGVKRIHVVRR